ncbi:class I SAM-dependent methyltransferase|uniref:Cyclopropane-fatty-acyl-phospholipid synthase n=1 Tax=Dendrosporobacter quercicolus TaxID=146817 RepID=A0A1G9SIP4_9FIRM|nr:cyclopropane-fatty-acyl-phospholipid synthase family protein [Dendrosporobacter quercicolus]NSL48705.1 class I SAM-dependent methyltransferase [Dendrosporobacter quercicolus DSM 1736]SDM35281.1 cyclopropane-fatty-acyl-phospholipid synthase [Dendrosporobacter quercicolus]
MLKKMALKLLLGKWKQGGFKVVFWDGEEAAYGDEPPAFTIIFRQEPPFKVGDDIVLLIGEAYMDGIIELEGSMDDILRIITLNRPSRAAAGPKKSGAVNSAAQQRNIHHHYDLGNDFFALWLDESMSYSCAYFNTPTDSLAQAQLQKIDHILKKINLQPGERLLDIGSGWGWLIIKAAQQYNVQATGITLSTEQYQATKRRIEELGLEHQVDVQLVSYQDLDSSQPRFDKIISVGMFEHVGQGNLSNYMRKINELLAPGGISLLHTITGLFEENSNAWIAKYIFPGGYVPSLREIIRLLPEFDFHLLHAESLRLHYAMTLDRWYENFSRQLDAVREKYDERFIRMWSLYLRGCAAAFRVSGLDIYQLLFSKGLNNSLPLTYQHLYDNQQ